jgi:two-component system nitrogen regulation sensor histidine kinase GlnL
MTAQPEQRAPACTEITFEDIATAVIIFDAHQKPVYANMAAQTILQLGQKTIYTEYQNSHHAVLCALKQAVENAAFRQVKTVYDRFETGQHYFDYTLTRLEDGRIICEFQRITESGATKAASLEWTAHMLGHELRTPIAGIKGVAQLLALTQQTDKDKDLLTMLHHEVERIENLSRSFDIFSGVQPMTPTPLNIHELLDQAAVHIPEGVEIIRNYDPSLPMLAGEKSLLQMMFLNLIKNATEVLADTSEPQIRLVTGYDADFRQEAVRYPYKIEICDNGPGISAAHLDKIFQPFFTTRTKGQGIGLALVRQIAEAHSGVVRVFSEPGCTRFILNFKING